MSFIERSSFRTNLAFEAKRLSSNAPTLMLFIFLFESFNTLELMTPFQASTFHTTDVISANMSQLFDERAAVALHRARGRLLQACLVASRMSASGNAG